MIPWRTNTPKTILVIDDEPGYRALLSSDFSRLGYVVLTAANGLEALKILEGNSVDVVITDMRMTPMDGLETILSIRKTHVHLPVVLMTGYAVEERLKKALEFQPVTWLKKPFGIDEMRTVVHDLVGAGT
ncbi:MAG: response regulator [Elusimicrobia bacterium]|nr:response regulator [Candidatus Obscuribacterium magneticum]